MKTLRDIAIERHSKNFCVNCRTDKFNSETQICASCGHRDQFSVEEITDEQLWNNVRETLVKVRDLKMIDNDIDHLTTELIDNIRDKVQNIMP